MYACLAVTCHLHFWQNDQDFLCATVVTRGWNGYRTKSQHRKSTLEKKILPPFQQGFEPATFQSRVRRSNHWAIPAPCTSGRVYVLLFTRMPGESYRRRLRSLLLCLCDVFRALIISLVRWLCTSLLGLVLLQMLTLTPSLSHPVKFPVWMMYGHACKKCIFRSYNTSTFNAMSFDENLFTCQCEEGDKEA